MKSFDSHYGHADRVNRWARGAMAFVVLIAIGTAVLVSGRSGEKTAVEGLSSRAGSFTVSPITLVSRSDRVLGIPGSTTTTTTARDILTEVTAAATSTSLDIAAVASPDTTPTTPATAPTQSTTTRPPATTTSTTTTLPAATTTTTTSSTTTTIPNPGVSIFLSQLRGSSARSGDGWEASVRVTIDATKGGVDLRGIMVTGAWTGAFDAEVSGQTNRQGRVTFNTPLLTSGELLVFQVKSVFLAEYFYESGLNLADSAITITRSSDHPVQLARLFR